MILCAIGVSTEWKELRVVPHAIEHPVVVWCVQRGARVCAEIFSWLLRLAWQFMGEWSYSHIKYNLCRRQIGTFNHLGNSSFDDRTKTCRRNGVVMTDENIEMLTENHVLNYNLSRKEISKTFKSKAPRLQRIFVRMPPPKLLPVVINFHYHG